MVIEKTKPKFNPKSLKNVLLLLFLISISAFRLNMVIALGAFLIITIYSIIVDKKIVISGILKWGILFWGYYLLSSFWSSEPNDTFRYISAVVYIIGIYIFLPKLVKTEEEVNNTINIIFYSLAFTAIYMLILTPFSQFGTERMGQAINMNANVFGFRMAIGALISVYLIKDCSKVKTKANVKKIIFWVIFLLLFTILTLFSGSKKSLFFLLASICLFEFIDTQGIKKLFKFAFVLMLVMIVIYMIFNNAKLYNVIGYRFERFFLTINGSNTSSSTDKSLVERQFYMEKAIELFKEKPFFGNGGNSFVTHMREIGYSHIAYSHNNYTEIMCTLGITGLIIYYFYWLKTVIGLIKILKNSDDLINRRISLLFFIITIMLLILDYGCVSYIVEFNLFLLCLFDIYVRTQKSKLDNH